MTRKNILDLLYHYQPPDMIEIQYKKEMIDFIRKNEDCFQRTYLKGHMTASGWLINQKKDKVLLMHHKKLNEWFQFGGHADGDNDLLKVAIKETKEESGLENIFPMMSKIFDIDIHCIPEYKGIPAHLHYDIRFLLQLQSDEIEKKNEESLALDWFNKDITNFPNHKSSMIRMFNKWLFID